MAQSNTGDSGRAWLNLETSLKSQTESQATFTVAVFLTSRNVSDSTNRFFVFSNATNSYVRDGVYSLNGTYNRTLLFAYDITHNKVYGATQTFGHEANFSGVEFWGTTLVVLENYTVPARAYVAPGTPGSLSSSIASNGQSMTLSWSTPSAGSASLNGVNIQIGTSSTSPTQNENSTQTWRTSWTETGLTPGVPYYARVRARNAHNQWSGWSGIHTRTNIPGTPGKPSVGSITTTGATGSWSAAANGGTAITGYNVEWSTSAGVVVRTNTTTGTGTSNASGALSPNATYRVRVQARNANGTGAWSAYSNNFTTGALAPNAPSTPTVTRNSDTSQGLAWTLTPTSDRPISGVTVQRWNNVSNAWETIATLGSTATSYTDTGTVADRRYQYRVRTEGGGGSSAWATSSGLHATTPSAPTTAQAVKNDDQSITLTWVATSSFRDVTSYQVFESTNGGTTWGSTALATVSAGTVSWRHASPDPAVTHTYRVRAVAPTPPTPALVSGYATSPTVQLQAPPNAPTVQGPLGTVDAANTVRLDWLHNPVDSSVQRKYQIQWRVQGTSSWTNLGTFTSATEYRDVAPSPLGWTNGTTVEWQVRTWGVYTGPLGSDGAGGSPWSTTFSFMLRATPSVVITQPSEAVWELPTLDLVWSFFQEQSDTQANWEAELYEGGSVTGTPAETRTGTGAATETTFNRVLPDLTAWTVRVRSRSSSGLWSPWAVRSFTVDYPEPSVPTVLLGWDRETGWTSVTITNPAGEPVVVSNTIQRRINGGEWVTLASDIPPNGSFVDREGAVAGFVEYRAIAWSALPSASASEPQAMQFLDGGQPSCDWPEPVEHRGSISRVRQNLINDPRGTVATRWSAGWGTDGAGTETMITPETPKRTNIVTDPRATNAAQWTQNFGTGGAGTETMVTEATDGPVLPDGTQATTYARTTWTTGSTGTAAEAGFDPPVSTTPLGVGAVFATAIYVRASAEFQVRAGADGEAGSAFAERSQGPVVTTPAGGWTRLGVIYTVGLPTVTGIRVKALITQAVSAGTTIDVTCAMAEPGATEVGPHFDGDSPNVDGVINAWTGTPNASTSTQAFNDGPVLPDGTQVGTYARYTMTTANTGGTPYFGPGFGATEAEPFVYTEGVTCAAALYIRPSVPAPAAYANAVYRRADDTTVGTTGNSTSALAAGEWTQFGTVFVPPFAESMRITPRANLSQVILPVGATVDVTCALVEPEAATVDTYFDGSSPDTLVFDNAWVGAENASPSTQTIYNLMDWPRIVTESAWVSGGPDFTQVCQALLDLTITQETGLMSRVLQRFAGRDWPVEFSGRARASSVSLTFTLPYTRRLLRDDISHLAGREEWEALSYLAGPHLYRDHQGRRFYVSLSPISQDGGNPRAVSLSLTRVEE